jgi:hypothetical protein
VLLGLTFSVAWAAAVLWVVDAGSGLPFLAMIAVTGVLFWVLPEINRWRPGAVSVVWIATGLVAAGFSVRYLGQVLVGIATGASLVAVGVVHFAATRGVGPFRT